MSCPEGSRALRQHHTTRGGHSVHHRYHHRQIKYVVKFSIVAIVRAEDDVSTYHSSLRGEFFFFFHHG